MHDSKPPEKPDVPDTDTPEGENQPTVLTDGDFRRITEELPIRIAVVDTSERFVFSNRAHQESWARTAGEIVGRKVERVIGEDNYREAAPYLHRALQGESITFEIKVQYALGQPRFVRVNYLPLYTDSQEIRGCFIAAFDVTDQKLSEEALRESEARFRQIIQNTRAIPWESEIGTGTMVFVGPQAEEILGYPIENWYRPFFWRELIHPDERVQVIEQYTEFASTAEEFELEYRMMHRDGSFVWVRDIVSVLRSHGESIGLQGFLVDITASKEADFERRKLEERLRQFQKMEALGTLAGGIAHDFNNILGGILGYTELALGRVTEDALSTSYLERVRTSSYRARELVQQILSFTRGQQSEKKPVELAPLITEVVSLVRATLPSSIHVDCILPGDPLATLANVTQLHQVLLNICTNAAHAMKVSGGTLSISLQRVVIDEDLSRAMPELGMGTYCCVTIVDTGHGMSSEVRERIFEPYYTTKSAGEGSGLGLSVAHGIVVSHGGAIIVESELGRGTSFRVFLPETENLPEQIVSVVPEISHRTAHERILFVDDEEVLAELGRDMLQHLGYRVTALVRSSEAYSLFCQAPQHYDLVITDQTMPDLAGDILIGKIRKIRPDIPVILCTGYSALIDERRARQIGVAEFLLKPYSLVQLCEAVQRVLQQAGAAGGDGST